MFLHDGNVSLETECNHPLEGEEGQGGPKSGTVVEKG